MCSVDLNEAIVYMSEMLPLVVDPADPMLKYCTKVAASHGVGQMAVLACAPAQSGYPCLREHSTWPV